MPETTTLHQWEIEALLADKEIHDLLMEASKNTGRRYQLAIRPQVTRRGLFGKRNPTSCYDMYVHVGGVFDWQCIRAGSGERPVVIAYLYGLINGASTV